MLSWFVSPIVAGLISGYFFCTICLLTLDAGLGKNFCKRNDCRLLILTLIAGTTALF